MSRFIYVCGETEREFASYPEIRSREAFLQEVPRNRWCPINVPRVPGPQSPLNRLLSEVRLDPDGRLAVVGPLYSVAHRAATAVRQLDLLVVRIRTIYTAFMSNE